MSKMTEEVFSNRIVDLYLEGLNPETVRLIDIMKVLNNENDVFLVSENRVVHIQNATRSSGHTTYDVLLGNIYKRVPNTNSIRLKRNYSIGIKSFLGQNPDRYRLVKVTRKYSFDSNRMDHLYSVMSTLLNDHVTVRSDNA